MQTTPTEKESMPCPRCKKIHERGLYIPRPDLRTDESKGVPHAPADVQCDCGTMLRVTVPFFKTSVFGWNWRIL